MAGESQTTTLPAYRAPSGIGSLEPKRMDVPWMPDIYYVPETDNFYSRSAQRGMGDAFYRANIHLMGRTATDVR